MFATVLRYFPWTLSPARSPRNRAKPATARKLRLEGLEGRCLLSYVITDLGTLPGYEASNALDVNRAGKVVGAALDYDTGTSHAFLWNNTAGMIDLGTLGGPSSVANAINDAGQVVGAATTGALDAYGNPIWHAFLWENYVMTDLGMQGSANDINSSGQIVGNDTFGAFLRDRPAGTTTYLGTLPEYTGSWAAKINDAGQVVGTAEYAEYFTGFVWTPSTPNGSTGAMIGLGNPWGDSTWGTGINASGQVAGFAHGVYSGWGPSGGDDGGGWAGGETIEVYYAFAGPNGAWSQLPTVNGAYAFASDINAAGQVVGVADSGAAIWQDGMVSPLNQEIAIDSGWWIEHASAINDSGQITGHGTTNGRQHAFLLTPTPSLRVSDVTITEGHAGSVNAVFSVSLSPASEQTVVVNFSTADATALSVSDYGAASGTLTFAPGETSKVIHVMVSGDRRAEPNESFFVNLSGATNATIVDSQGLGAIVDDEPRISISDATKSEGKRGQTTLFTFTVTLSVAYDQAVTMSYRTVNGTATTGDSDYIAKTGTLTFNPGETTKAITIEVRGDSKKEADETFYLDLFSNSSNSLFTKNRGIGTILNDD